MTLRPQLSTKANEGPLVLAWEASALLHASRTDRLDVLLHLAGSLAPEVRHVTTAAVGEELQIHGLPTPATMSVQHVDGLAELISLAAWVQRLSSRQHNRGEATICAWAEVHGATAIIDDGKARRAASKAGLVVHGTAWVVAQAVMLGNETPAGASALLDTFLADGARYPFRTGGFIDWAKNEGLLVS
jgi:predicted nucleic acid-binding protein